MAEGGGFEPPRPSRDGLGSAIRRITALPPFRVLLVARAGVAPAPPVFQAGALLPELPRVVPGSEGRIRTDDQRVTKPLLWPLSYLGTFLAPRAGLEPARALARRRNRAVWLPVSPPRNICFWRRARDSNPDSLLRETAVFETGAIAVRPAPRFIDVVSPSLRSPGTAGRDRTSGPCLRAAVLFRLSYGGAYPGTGGGIRTHTERCLRPPPLPIGLLRLIYSTQRVRARSTGWSGWLDSNQRPLPSEGRALPD